VARLGKQAKASPEAIKQKYVTNAEGKDILLSQVAEIKVSDGQTIIARLDRM
jgi:multidrug efflux pump subunit AcrB